MLKTYKQMNADNNGKANECYTKLDEVTKLINFLNNQQLKNITIWCPFDKDESNIVIGLKLAGYNVINTHIDTGQDFLNYKPDFEFHVMISNPPFSKRTKFFNKINSYNKPYIMLQPIMYFNNNSMIKELINNSEKYRFLMPNNRMGFIKNNIVYNKTTSFYSFWLCKGLFLNKNTFIELK
jgi:hypothetical protein